jgi:hypothetical protein
VRDIDTVVNRHQPALSIGRSGELPASEVTDRNDHVGAAVSAPPVADAGHRLGVVFRQDYFRLPRKPAHRRHHQTVIGRTVYVNQIEWLLSQQASQLPTRASTGGQAIEPIRKWLSTRKHTGYRFRFEVQPARRWRGNAHPMANGQSFGQRHQIRRVTAAVTVMEIGQQELQEINLRIQTRAAQKNARKKHAEGIADPQHERGRYALIVPRCAATCLKYHGRTPGQG